MLRRLISPLSLLLCALSFAIATVVSCTKTETTIFQTCALTCVNGGQCQNNICICPAGYEGSGCQRAWNTKFDGSFTDTAGGGQAPVRFLASPVQPDLFTTTNLGVGEVRYRRVDSLRFRIEPVSTPTLGIDSGSGNINISGRVIAGAYFRRRFSGSTSIRDTVNFSYIR